jgi:hypothetical protein
MADTSLADVDLEEVLLRLTRHAQGLFGAFRLLGLEAVDIAYPGGDGPEDLAMNLLVQFLDPADSRVRWSDGQPRPNTERVCVFLKKALDRDFFDLKKSKRYKTTVYVNDESSEDERTLTLEQLAGHMESPEGQLLKKERVQRILDQFNGDPKAKEMVELQLSPDGYSGFSNQDLAQLLDTTVQDIENRKKRVTNQLLKNLPPEGEGTGTYA